MSEPTDTRYLRRVRVTAFVALLTALACLATLVVPPYPWPMFGAYLGAGALALYVLAEELRLNSTWTAPQNRILLAVAALCVAAGLVRILVDALA